MNYSTRQRTELLDYLRANPDRCYTVREIIAEGGLNVGEATVYRALSRFVAEGSVKKYVTGDGGAHFQYVAGEDCESHFHLRCLSWGHLFHTECEVLEEMVRHIESEHGFRVDSVHTTIYGICRECDAANAKEDET